MIQKLTFLGTFLLIHQMVFASDYDAERARKSACIILGDRNPAIVTEEECSRYRLDSDVRSLRAFSRDLQQQAKLL